MSTWSMATKQLLIIGGSVLASSLSGHALAEGLQAERELSQDANA
jgi:hypothetical protein